MRGTFLHDYDSENFIRYVSEQAKNGIHQVVYFEKGYRPKLEDRAPIELIVADSPAPPDPNIARFRTADPPHFELPRGSYHYLGQGYDFHREMAKILNYPYLYSQRRWADGSTDHEQIKKLTGRIYKLEQRQSILFRAIEKMLKRLRWIKKGREELPF